MLLEREAELEAIGAAVERAAAGQGGVLVVEGVAGIGKSSLLAAAPDERMRVLRARGVPLEQTYAFGVVRSLFGRRALEGGFVGPGEEARRAALFELTWLATDLAAAQPLLIVVDDAHWADPPSLRWLAHFARRIEAVPALVLLAVRSGEPPSDAALLDELRGYPTLRPAPLGRVATTALSGDTECFAATGGNPFLVHAWVRSGAADEEAVARDVAQRLDRLPDARPVALAIAILGPGAGLPVVAALAGVDLDRAAAAADALRAAGLLAPDARLEFAHPILSAAVLAGLGPSQTARWHARAWRLLEDAERQALHLLAADPEGAGEAVAVLRAAARAASARGASESAAAYLRRALLEPPAPDVRPDVLLECGLALAAHRDPAAPPLLREAVASKRDAGAALQAARALALAALYDDVIEICGIGLADTGDASPDVVARLEAELIGIAMTRAEATGDAIARLERTRRDPPSVPLWKINAAGYDTFAGGPAAAALELLHDPALASEQDSLVGSVVRGLLLIWNDDLESALAHADALLAYARPRGWESLVANGSFLRAMAMLRLGRVAEALEDARASYEFKVSVGAPPDSRGWATAPYADALLEHGEVDAAEAVLNPDELAPGVLTRPILYECRARVRLAQQRPAEALADAYAARDEWALRDADGPCLVGWRVCAIDALEDRALARALATEQLAVAERHASVTARLAALRALAFATSDLAPLMRGLTPNTPIGRKSPANPREGSDPSRLERLRALVDLGAALRRRGRLEAAREPLREALHRADRDGAVRLAERARAELVAAGARPRRPALAGRDALTPAERRVARLAAEGRTNRQIAQELFVTQRTVETHLTHTFAKLDIGSRDELATAL